SLALAASLWSASAAAGPSSAGDAEVQKLIKGAMEEDWLATKFDAAEAKLKRAANTCQKRCSPPLGAKVHGYLAVLYDVVKKDPDKALEELKEMLKLDIDATPDKSFATPELLKAFEGAKKEADKAAADAKKASDKAASDAKKAADDAAKK